MSVVSIRDLGRNPSSVIDDVARTGRPAVVTRNGRPVAALVRIDQVALEDWVLASLADPPVGQSLEREPADLVASAPTLHQDYNKALTGLTTDEAEAFFAALDEL